MNQIMKSIRVFAASFAVLVPFGNLAATDIVNTTIEFRQIQGYHPDTGTEGTFVTPAWSRIDEIRFDFVSGDPLFNSGQGPNGGETGVEIGVVSEDGAGVRTGISSVSVEHQTVVLFPNPTDPYQTFERVAGLLMDGELTVSLGAFECFPTHCLPLMLMEPSELTLTVTGMLAAVDVAVDVKPGSCPNPVNLRGRGVVPVAVLGTAELDVREIDPTSIRLQGIPALRSGFEDVGLPFEPFRGKQDPEDCSDLDGDGWEDLTLKFDKQVLAEALGDPPAGTEVVLQLTGSLYDGMPIAGEDVIVVRGRKDRR